MNAIADVFSAKRYSQFGEDGVLAWLFHGRKNGFYVDIGCHHPFRFSNTAMLHTELGWTGINIDVDERAIALFDRYRPNDINLTMGVAGEAGRRMVTIFEEGAINSFDATAASHPAWEGISRHQKEVEVQPLRGILHMLMPRNKTITLLNIDAEGLDLEILISNDWTLYRPEVILVEVEGFGGETKTHQYLTSQNYELISHVALTSIYRSKIAASMTDEEVVWLYRCLLDREPESPEAIAWFKSENKTFEQGQAYLRRSDEFKAKNSNTRQLQYYIPQQAKDFKKSKKKLALATIVKNEEKYIENMVRSCAPLLDYVVLVDTGSIDQTVEIAKRTLQDLGIRHAVDKIAFEDFSRARNAALRRVPADIDWILMLDADEELVQEDLKLFCELLEADDSIDGWQLPRMNFADSQKRKPLIPYPDFQLRLFRNKSKEPVEFVGKVHETPINVRNWGRPAVSECEHGNAGGPHIHHLGYMNITHENWQKKHNLYTSLASDYT